MAKERSTALTPYKPMPLAVPDTASSELEAFIREANKVPMLSPEEEHSLAVRYRDDNDLEAARQLVLSHLRLVISIARQFLGYGLPFSDLVQEGNIGLMKAVKRYDPDHGARLATFAMTWIRSEIQEFIIRNWRLVKVATTKSQRKLFFNLRSLKNEDKALNPEQTTAIANKLGVKDEEVSEMERRMDGGEFAIDEPVKSDENLVSPEDWLYDEKDSPENQIASAEREKILEVGLQQAIKQLDPRSQRIISERWLYNDVKGEKGATLAELSKEFGISMERVRQIEKKAMTELRKILQNQKE